MWSAAAPSAQQLLVRLGGSRHLSGGAFRTRKFPIPTSLVPEGVPRSLSRRLDAQETPTLLGRESDAKIQAYIPSREGKSGVRAVLIDGPRGVGKSGALLRAVVKARGDGVVTMYVPSAREWTHGPGFFSATAVEGRDFIGDGAKAVRWYDRPRQSIALMRGLLDVHGNTLAEVQCGVGGEVVDKAGAKNLRELAEYGVKVLEDVDSDWRNNPRLGGDALDAVIRELVAQKEVPFLLAIDDYGSLLGLTDLVSQNKRCVHATGIRAVAELFGRESLPRLLGSMGENCAVMVAFSASHGAPNWRHSRVEGTADYPITDDVREDPTGRVWLKRVREFTARIEESGPYNLLDEDMSLDPISVSAAAFSSAAVKYIQVPEWSASECGAFVGEYQDDKKIRSLESPEKMRLFQLAGGRADVLRKLCMTQ